MSQIFEEELISIEKMCTLKGSGAFNPTWNLIKREQEIQMYEVHAPLIESQYGFVIDDIHIRLSKNELGIIIPFEDTEKICWECGAERMLEFKINMECMDLDCVNWFDWCYNAKFIPSSKNMQFPYEPEYDCVTEMLDPGPSELIRGGDYDGYAIKEYARHQGWDWYK